MGALYRIKEEPMSSRSVVIIHKILSTILRPPVEVRSDAARNPLDQRKLEDADFCYNRRGIVHKVFAGPRQIVNQVIYKDVSRDPTLQTNGCPKMKAAHLTMPCSSMNLDLRRDSCGFQAD